VTVAPADQAGQPTLHDVLVIGGGPAGSSCAYWLAEAGWDVVVVEKKHFPREKTCGDGLTPRSVRQLDDMGLKGSLNIGHRFVGLRSCAFGKTLEMRWPEHPTFPSEGFVITRMDLDQLVAERAAKAGADLRQGCEAVEPILGGTPAREGLPTVAGAVVAHKDSQTTSEIKARYVVVADGSNSRFGRALGTSRDRGFPLGMALRGYYRSPRSDDQFIESHLDLRDPSGAVVPGYGWIFPLGNGLVNVGVGLLSVNGRWKGVNTSHLMDAFVESAPASWGLSPDGCCGPPTGGKLPMGFAVSPLAGANTIVVGDAAGCINPFNGEGIAYGYETGRLAASCLSRALAGEGDAAIAQYPSRLQDAYGDYYRVGRAFVKLISNPHALRACVRFGMEVPPVMVALMRIMANLMRPDTHAPPEMAYRAMEAVGRLVP
jgi:menaquinone-9 beta-reductase